MPSKKVQSLPKKRKHGARTLTRQKVRDVAMLRRLDSREECLLVLKSCSVFNEKHLYGIVLDHLLPICTVSPDYIAWNCALRDRVCDYPLDAGLSGVRFCFNECLTISTFLTLDIGLTTRHAPYQPSDERLFIAAADAIYTSLQSVSRVKGDKYANFQLDCDLAQIIDGSSPKEGIDPDNRLVYVDILKNQDIISITVGHDSPTKFNQLQKLTITITNDKFLNVPLRPFVTTRRITSISIYPLL